QRFVSCSLAIEGRVRENRSGRKRHKMQTCAARSRNDRVWIAVKPLLLAEIRGCRVDPDERVLVAGNSLKLVGIHPLVALNDGPTVYISRYNTPVSTRFLTALG